MEKKNFERRNLPDLVLENAKILFCNFSGRERQYNDAGKKNFNVVIDEATAKDLLRDGWNVKEYVRNRGTEDEEIIHHLQVKVEFEPKNPYFKPPKVVVIRGEGDNEIRKSLNKLTINQLDWMKIRHVHCVIHPSQWDDGKYSAYCVTLYAYVEGNPIEEKYGYVDDEEESADEPLPFE